MQPNKFWTNNNWVYIRFHQKLIQSSCNLEGELCSTICWEERIFHLNLKSWCIKPTLKEMNILIVNWIKSKTYHSLKIIINWIAKCYLSTSKSIQPSQMMMILIVRWQLINILTIIGDINIFKHNKIGSRSLLNKDEDK